MSKTVALDTAAGPIGGFYDPRFEGVLQAFHDNFTQREEVGASVALTLDGKRLVDLWGGRRPDGQAWGQDTVCTVFSSTKGAMALCAHLLCERGLLDLDAPVTRYWREFGAGGKEFARNGGMTGPDTGEVDRFAHFVNVHMLDRHGNRINRRNPQDIFTPLYDKQIPPGGAAVLHYRLDVPRSAAGPVEITTRLRYRKFDYEYMQLVHGGKVPPKLPIVDICEDRLTLPMEGGSPLPSQTSPVKPAWQRWNDYGIGCLLEGGGKRGHFRQAEAAFAKLLTLGEKGRTDVDDFNQDHAHRFGSKNIHGLL